MPRTRTKACIPCQKLKVRCLVNHDLRICQRCETKGIQCVFKRAPMYWKSTSSKTLHMNMAEDLETLHAAVNRILADRHQKLLDPLKTSQTAIHAFESPSPPGIAVASSPKSVTAAPTGEDVGLPINQAESPEPLNQHPIKSLYEITQLESLRSRQLSPTSSNDDPPSRGPVLQDLVSDGLLRRDDADRLVQTFLNHTDHYLYGINGRFRNTDGIRGASSLLFTAICTVSALHEPNAESLFQVCSSKLRDLVSNFVFANQTSIEDFQGLCIASFWLSDISWSVSGLAIRRAMEFQLAKSFDILVGDETGSRSLSKKIKLDTRTEALNCLRVWYLLYICDHHLSILYGRPSSFGHQISVESWKRYLRAVNETELDVRLASQIELLLILDKVPAALGAKGDTEIPLGHKMYLEDFNCQLDTWVARWTSSYKPHKQIGDFPRQAVMLHYHFSKLFVSSHVFRKRPLDPKRPPVPVEFFDIASVAVQSARAIVELVSQDGNIRTGFVSMPHYYHTMIAYACVFILKIAAIHGTQFGLDRNETLRSIEQVAELCRTRKCTRHHLVHLMGAGLQKLISSYKNGLLKRVESYDTSEHPERDQQTNTSRMPYTVQREGPGTELELSLPNDHGLGPEQINLYQNDVTLIDPGLWHNESISAEFSELFDANMDVAGMQLGWDAMIPSFNAHHSGFAFS